MVMSLPKCLRGVQYKHISTTEADMENYNFDNVNKKTFGKYVKKCRKNKNMTQYDLAILLGLQVKSISCIERGETFPSQENIFKLAMILDMSLDEYIFGYRLNEETISSKEVNDLISGLTSNQKSFVVSTLKTMCENINSI